MRNLKRVLSLALAAMMLIGMMVVGAGAANTGDFTDYGEIKHTEAVNTMVTLNVFNGKEDGSYFAPNDTLTREEMSKIIAYVMNGGKEPVLGVKETPTYSDIDGIWSEKYIEYATSMGIIAGDGTGKFNPKDPLTGEQAAKMLLAAMGYNAEVFGFTGNSWSTNVNRYANEAGLYEDLEGLDPSQPISRDDACQLAYNAIQAPRMIRSWSQDQTTGDVTEMYTLAGTNDTVFSSLLSKYFNGHIYEGVLVATGEYDLSAIIGTNGGDASIDSFVVNVDRYDNQTADANHDGDTYFEYEDMDLTALMGQYVKVLYNAKTETVYGIYSQADKNSVLETAASLTDYTGLTNKVKVDGTTYNLESDIVYIYGEDRGTKAQTSDLTRADKVVYVDNDGNGKFDLAIVTPVDVAKVTFLNSTNITFAPVLNNATQNTNAQLVEDVILSEGLAKDDYAVLTPSYYNDADTLTKIDVASGTVSGVRNPVNAGQAPYNDYQIDGEWYKVAVGNGTIANSAIKSGSTVDYIAVDNVLFYAKLTSGATLSDVAVISELAGDTDTFGRTCLMAKVMFSDGTTKEVTVGGLYDSYDDTTSDNDKNAAVSTTEAGYIGVLVSYKVDNDGNYDFYLLSNRANNKAGFDTVVSGADVGTVTGGDLGIDGNLVADDAVIVVRNTAPASTINGSGVPDANSMDGKITYVSGADFKKLNLAKFDSTNNYASALIGKDADGFSRVMFAIVTTTAAGYDTANDKFTLGTINGSNYGYLTKDSWTETIDGNNYNCFEVWTGTETVTLKAKDSATKYTARGIISYDEVGDGIIKNVTVNGTGWAEGAITAFTSSNVEIDGTTYKLTQDTVILNVDDTLKTGLAGNALLTATEIGSTGAYVKNARYIVNSANEIKAIVVDINNEIVAAAGNVVVPGTVSTSDLNEILAAVDSVSVSGALSLTSNVTIPAGTTLTLGGATAATTYKFVGGGTLNVPSSASIDQTEAVSTKITLSASTTNVPLPAPSVIIGSHVGDIGTNCDNGSYDIEFDIPGTCDGAGIYQFDFSGLDWTPSSTVKVSRTSADSVSPLTLKSADDLAVHFNDSTGNKLYIEFDVDGADPEAPINFVVTYLGA